MKPYYKVTMIFKPIDRGDWDGIEFPPWFEKHLTNGCKDFTPVADTFEVKLIEEETDDE